MISSHKVIFFSMCLLLSSFVFSDAFGGGIIGSRRRNLALEALLATGIITLLMRGNGDKHGGGYGKGLGSGGHGHSFGGYGHLMHFGGLDQGRNFGLTDNVHSMATIGHLPMLSKVGHISEFHAHELGQDLMPGKFKSFPDIEESLNNKASVYEKSLPDLPEFPSFPGFANSQSLPEPGPIKNTPSIKVSSNPTVPEHNQIIPENGHSQNHNDQRNCKKEAEANTGFDFKKYGYSDKSTEPGHYNGFGGSGRPVISSPSKTYDYTTPQNYASPEKYDYDYRGDDMPENPSEGGTSMHKKNHN